MAGRSNWNRGYDYREHDPYSMMMYGRSHMPPATGLFGAARSGRDNRDYRMPRDRAPPRAVRKRSRSHERSRGREGKESRSGFHPKYEVKANVHVFEGKEVGVNAIRRRFTRMYTPSDFFHSDLRWQECFPLYDPFKIGSEAQFHVFSKEVDVYDVSGNLVTETDNDLLDPPDADYTYSAKVMLLASPDIAKLYQNSIRMADEEPAAAADKESVFRQLGFLVGCKGKNEVMAIGGPWSPSLDGDKPAEDPQVLINTAIRTCKAQTGIDLSRCNHWYKFLELHYFRPADRVLAATKSNVEEQTEDGSSNNVPAEPRVETVIMFLPDVHNCMPTNEEWRSYYKVYSDGMQQKLNPPVEEIITYEKEESSAEKDISMQKNVDIGDTEKPIVEDGQNEATHHSQLDVSAMKVADLRSELEARTLDTKGIKTALVERLKAALRDEAAKELEANALKVDGSAAKAEQGEDQSVKEVDDAKEENVPVELTEKDKRRIERLYKLDETKPAILVHPNRKARNGKFDCQQLTLHTLLSYRMEDQKEHTFEVSLFVELFRDMVLRDAAFTIYKGLTIAEDMQGGDERLDDDAKRRKLDGELVNGDTEKVRKVKRTVDTDLLFAFSEYDTGYADYIKDSDVEDIIMSLNLNLSRSQVRKLVTKVGGRKDCLSYRILTDKHVVEGSEDDVICLNKQLEDEDYIMELALGNRVYFEENQKPQPPHVIMHTGTDEKLLEKYEKSEDRRKKVELQFSELTGELERTRKLLNCTRDDEEKIRGELKTVRDTLNTERDGTKELRSSNKVYHRLLNVAHEQMDRAMREINRQFDKEKATKEAQEKRDAEEATKLAAPEITEKMEVAAEDMQEKTDAKEDDLEVVDIA